MRIKDTIHGEIQIDEKLIIDLIQTFEFQRLRKIKQLGVANFTFPGAEHTRYNHSIGVYHIINKIVEKFKNQGEIFFTPQEELAIKVTGLIHDLGHGPLSHAAEVFFNYSHEQYTVKIIQNPQGEVYKILKQYDETNKTNIIDNVINFINKTHKNGALNSLISSTVDADRMDYLLRDSYYTGTVYGNVDIQRLIAHMEYYENKIVFDKKILYTLEDFILSRYHMFIQVYLNEKSLIYEKLIQKILLRVSQLQQEDYSFENDISILLNLMKNPIDVNDYIKINDYNFMALIESFYYEKDERLKELVGVLLKRVNFYEEIKNDHQTNDDEIVLVTDQIKKKVYSDDKSIYIKLNDKYKEIEDVSKIFAFSKQTLVINIEEKKYKVLLK